MTIARLMKRDASVLTDRIVRVWWVMDSAVDAFTDPSRVPMALLDTVFDRLL